MFKYLFDKTVKPVEATCTNLSLNHYLKNNFKVIKVYKNGLKKVRYENIQ